MARPAIGFTLQPDEEFLERCAAAIAAADYLELAPETTWWQRGDALAPNGFHRRFLTIGERAGKRFVAHGVGLSVGTGAREDRARRALWLDRIAEDHRRFDFAWYSDHLGASSLAGLTMSLPMPLPLDASSTRAVRRRLAELQRIVADVAVENSVTYFLLGAPLDEARFLSRVVSAPRRHLVLDLHNVWTMSQNLRFDPRAWLAELDLGKVIELHVSGGADSDPAWLPSGRALRLDSHDAAVPDEVWRLVEEIGPRCPNLRGVTLERMEGTVGDGDGAQLAREVRRLRALATRW